MELGLLILRLVVGLTMAAHGGQKLFGWFDGGGPAGTGAFMEQLGFRPGKLAAIGAGMFEFAGGLLLAFGFLTAVGALMVITVLTVATATVHLGKGYFNTNGGFELPAVLSAGALCLALVGPGAFSIDAAAGISTHGPAWGAVAIGGGFLLAFAAMATRRPRVRAAA
jgi:putative oxidoreductase